MRTVSNSSPEGQQLQLDVTDGDVKFSKSSVQGGDIAQLRSDPLRMDAVVVYHLRNGDFRFDLTPKKRTPLMMDKHQCWEKEMSESKRRARYTRQYKLEAVRLVKLVKLVKGGD